jgi:hypothetical protein
LRQISAQKMTYFPLSFKDSSLLGLKVKKFKFLDRQSQPLTL